MERKITLKIRNLGEYNISAESYDIFQEITEAFISKKSTILKKVVPLSIEGTALTVDMLNNENTMYLRGLVPIFYNIYYTVNTSTESDIQSFVKILEKTITENSLLESISYMGKQGIAKDS